MRHPDPSVQIWRVETAGDGGNELLQRFLPCIITSNLKCLLLIQPPARQTLPATFIRVSCISGLSFNPLLLIFCKSCLMHASTQGFLHQELDLNWGHLNKQKTSEEIHEKWLYLDFLGGCITWSVLSFCTLVSTQAAFLLLTHSLPSFSIIEINNNWCKNPSARERAQENGRPTAYLYPVYFIDTNTRVKV